MFYYADALLNVKKVEIGMTDNRSLLIRKNIIVSFLLKGWSGIIQVLLIPFTLFCLGEYENGLWMTISSILLWIDSLDIGLGNGLRNKLSMYMAHGDIDNARKYVSSTFFMLVAIILPVCLLLITTISLTDIYSFLNVNIHIVSNLRQILIMCVTLVSATFIFKFIGNVYLGLQLPAVNNALVVGGQTLTLFLISIMRFSGVHSLALTAIAYTLSPLIVYLAAWPITFNRKYPELRPSLVLVDKTSVKELLSVGVEFFFLQIGGVILFASSNTMISHFFSPQSVTPYQIAYRYFSFTMMVFTIIAVPFWSATTDAYERKDIKWIKASIHKLRLLFFCIAIALLIMIVCSKWVYSVWVGQNISIPLSMTIFMAAYMLIIIYSLCYSYFLNGIGKLRLQIICTSIAAIGYFPIAYYLGKAIGIIGFLIALCLVNIPGAIINHIQFNRIVNGKAIGIWFK